MQTADDYIFRFVGKDDVTGTMRRIGSGAKTTETSVMGVQNRINGVRSGLRSAAGEIPGLNLAFNTLLSPIALAGAGVGLIAKEIRESTVAASKFNSEFRELQNLNLDKPIGELNRLKADVLGTAGAKGFDPYKTSTAFYDVQSITGMYGSDVAAMVGKQGEFARLMNADFNEYITGTGKAMTNFGFGVDQLDAYNRSAYATVKVGSITFEQLAKNQAVYAGYAASANQTFDSANKLMTLFTLKTKSAEESATMVKSAFTDLFKPEVIKSFEAAGVKMFDPTTHNARQVDDILLDLNKRFKMEQGQEAVNNLRNTFKGSEGLISLIQLATDRTGNLQRQLEAMNGASANVPGAKSIFENDVGKLKEMNDELRETIKILKGQRTTGLLHGIRSRRNEWLQGKSDRLNAELYMQNLGVGNNSLDPSLKKHGATDVSKQAFEWAKSTYGNDQELIDKRIKELSAPKDWFNVPDLIPSSPRFSPMSRSEYISSVQSRYPGSEKSGVGMQLRNFASTMYKGYMENSSNAELQAVYQLKNNISAPKADDTPKQDPLKTDATQNSINTISGGGVQHKNITITIDKVIEDVLIECNNAQEGIDDLEERVKQAMVRALQSTEQIMV